MQSCERIMRSDSSDKIWLTHKVLWTAAHCGSGSVDAVRMMWSACFLCRTQFHQSRGSLLFTWTLRSSERNQKHSHWLIILIVNILIDSWATSRSTVAALVTLLQLVLQQPDWSIVWSKAESRRRLFSSAPVEFLLLSSWAEYHDVRVFNLWPLWHHMSPKSGQFIPEMSEPSLRCHIHKQPEHTFQRLEDSERLSRVKGQTGFSGISGRPDRPTCSGPTLLLCTERGKLPASLTSTHTHTHFHN